MAQIKTRASDADVDDYLVSRANADQLADCKSLMALLRKLTRQAPKMWGPSIVGYGSYRYTYESGHSGEMCLVGFAIRGRELVLYLSVEGPAQQALLSRVGRHRMGKGCLYFKRFADLDPVVLKALVAGSIAELEQGHGGGEGA